MSLHLTEVMPAPFNISAMILPYSQFIFILFRKVNIGKNCKSLENSQMFKQLATILSYSLADSQHTVKIIHSNEPFSVEFLIFLGYDICCEKI